MEMNIDIGKDVHHSLIEIAKDEKKTLDVMALEMISLGIRVHIASLNKNESEDKSMSDDDKLRNILKVSIQNQELISEVLSMVFDSDSSRLGAYNADASIMISEKMAEKHIKGRELL